MHNERRMRYAGREEHGDGQRTHAYAHCQRPRGTYDKKSVTPGKPGARLLMPAASWATAVSDTLVLLRSAHGRWARRSAGDASVRRARHRHPRPAARGHATSNKAAPRPCTPMSARSVRRRVPRSRPELPQGGGPARTQHEAARLRRHPPARHASPRVLKVQLLEATGGQGLAEGRRADIRDAFAVTARRGARGRPGRWRHAR